MACLTRGLDLGLNPVDTVNPADAVAGGRFALAIAGSIGLVFALAMVLN